MKEIKLLIPEDQRIGEAIWKAVAKAMADQGRFDDSVAAEILNIEDQDLLSLLGQTEQRG